MTRFITSIDDGLDLEDQASYGTANGQAVLDTADATGSFSEDLPGQRIEERQGRSPSLKRAHSEDGWKCYKRTTLDIFASAKELKAETSSGVDPNDRADLIVQIEQLLEKLMTVRFGKNECLARCVVAVQSVLLRTAWDQHHVDFIDDVAAFLKSRSYVDDSTVEMIYQSVEQHELDPFRGVLSK